MTNDLRIVPDFTPTGLTQWDSSWPELAGKDERHHLLAYLEDRFGIPEELFDDYLLFKRKQSWLIMRNASQVMFASQLKVLKVGLKAFQKIGAFIKPTTRIIQIFGRAATRARLEIDEKQLSRLLLGEKLSVDLDLSKGYVILSLRENRILGLGFYDNGRVHSQLPRKGLRAAMI